MSGPETYLFNLKDQLELLGHEVDIFSLDYDENIKSKKENFFPNPIGSKSSYSFKDQNLSFIEKLRVIISLFYRNDVYVKLNELLMQNHYEAALILQFWGKLSPAIFRALKENNVPATLRISDFGLVCGTNTLLKNNKHSKECIKSKFGCIKNKCVDNSYTKSLINTLAQLNFRARYSKRINYIYTCKNTQSIFHDAGISNNSFHVPTFYPRDFIHKETCDSKKIIYLGRVNRDKGLHKMLPLFPDSSEIFLEIWGSGPPEYLHELKQIILSRKNKNIFLKGATSQMNIQNVFQDCIFSIIPSQWHDNLPNSLIESLSNGVPVIAPNHGCFPEFIFENENGFLYQDQKDLKNIFLKVQDLSEDKKLELSYNSTIFAKKTFSSKIHIKKLIEVISADPKQSTFQ